MHPRRKLIISCLAACLTAAGAGGQTLQARGGEAGWRTLTADGQHCVVDREATTAACWPASPGSQLSDLAGLGDSWIVAGSRPGDHGAELFLVRGDGAETSSLAPPPGDSPRGRPRLLADEDRLLGLVWLEGDRQETLSVRAAEWLGTRWTPPTTISPPGLGSQVAPSAAVLEDGRWLVVWTAFDGTDDEILWSVRDDRSWTVPARLHKDNEVPDITPSVLATSRGALVAWSAFDGRDYRLRVAHFDGHRWTERPVDGGHGVAWPRLAAGRRGALLSFSQVVPPAWVALELDAAGRELDRAELPSDATAIPWIDGLSYGARFEWPDGARATAAWRARP